MAFSLSHEIDLRHLARIIESSDDGIVSKDLDGTIRSWNPAAERLFGYTASEAIGRSIRMIIPPDRQGEEDTVLATIRRGEQLSHFETIRQRKDGTLIPILLTVSPIHDEAGNIIGASKIARDIGDRRLADVATRRLAAVVEWSDDAIVTKNLDCTITSWNRAAERLFGYTAAEAIGRSVRMIIPDRLQNEEDAVLARIRLGLAVEHYETVRLRKDGGEVDVSLTVSPVRDESGNVVGASKIARDISDRRRLAALLEERALVSQKLGEVGASIASSLDRGTIVQRVTGIATALTRAELGAFLYTRIEAESSASYTLNALTGGSAESFAAFLQPQVTAPVLDEGRVIRLDDLTHDARIARCLLEEGLLTERPPAERPQVCSLLAVPLTGRSGRILGGLFFGHFSAGAFTEQHEQLAIGIAGWAALALENAGLYLASREADRVKDEFLAVLSHELRTPLNAILGYARLLRGGILAGEKAARGLETLERNAAALTQIVDDVLDVSRIVTGKIRLDVQPVELPLIVHNAVATVQPSADAKGVRLQIIVDPQVETVSGDPDRLQQVLWNLLSNAVKFTPRHGRAEVRLDRVNSDVEIVVSDTGIGIRPEFLPFVFERFRQADSATTRTTGGLGLGLSIVRHLVEMHGGTVQVSSRGEGCGATFRIRLPVMIDDPRRFIEPREHSRATRLRPLEDLGSLTGIRVLAVEDEADALALLCLVLETAGAEVEGLSSAAAALDRIGTFRPHALIFDLGMPDMDGFDLIARVRSSTDADVRDIPAAALTALARPDDRTKALKSGFEMHLAKPVDPGELVASVATLVRRARTDRAS